MLLGVIDILTELKKLRYTIKMLRQTDDKMKKAQVGFIVDMCVMFIFNTICAGSFLAGLLKYTNISDEMTGLISAIPVSSSFFQLIGAITIGSMKNKKFAISLGIILHRISMSIMFFVPVFFGSSNMSLNIIVALYIIGHFANALISPEYNSWVINVTSDEMRADFFGIRERNALVCAAVSSIATSLVLDKFNALNLQLVAFSIIGFYLLISAVINIVVILKMYMPNKDNYHGKFKLSDITKPLKDRKFRNVLVLQILWQASCLIWIPFTGVYLINNLKANYSLIGIVAVVVSFEKAIFVRHWSKFVIKSTWAKVYLYALMIYGASTVLFIFLTPGNVNWLYIIQSFIGNIAWSIFGIALFNVQVENIDDDNPSIYFGLGGAVSSIGGFLSAYFGSKVYYFVNSGDFIINGMQALCLLSILFVILICLHLKFSIINKANI